ncbi:MAG: hypothetical protein PVH40_03600 [Gemmatimonadales bacterium]
MDNVTETYRQLTDALRSSLANQGFETVEEHHHAQPHGSRYIVLMNGHQAVCLTWDAAEEAFRLECCERTEGTHGGVWEMMCQERFHPLTDGLDRSRAVVDAITARLTEKLL